MEYEEKIAQFDFYCDVCDELVIKGSVYFEDEQGNRLCSICKEV